MVVRPLLACVLGASLVACGPAPEEETDAAAGPSIPRVEARAADGFADLGKVSDLALVPNTIPFLGRGVVALEDGGFALLDFAEGAATSLDGPQVRFLAAAPDFQLRGTSAPLIIAAGGALPAPAAYVFLAEDGLLVEIPMDPIETAGPVRAMCTERATQALIDLILFTDTTLERWRVSDRGGDRLAASQVESEPADRAIVACTGLNGDVATVTDNGVARVLGESRWGFSDGADVAAVEREDGWWAIVARSDQGASLIAPPMQNEVSVVFASGFNTPSTPAPTQVIASPANFGGSFGQGLMVVVQDESLNVVELNGFIESAKLALNGG